MILPPLVFPGSLISYEENEVFVNMVPLFCLDERKSFIKFITGLETLPSTWCFARIVVIFGHILTLDANMCPSYV
jgi:hypothetical protein